MRILFLPTYCKPEKAASGYLGRNRNQHYAELGWKMVVFAPTPCRGIDAETRQKYKSKEYRIETDFEGHRTIHRFSMYAEGKNPILRALRYFFISIKHLNRALFSRYATDIDVMFLASTPPYQGLLGTIVKKIRKIPYVYNLQDIFPDSLVGTGLAKKDGLLWKIGRAIENVSYRNAEKVIVISEDFKNNIMAKGVPEDKIEVIYNWVDEEAVVDVPREKNLLFDRYCLDRNKFYVTYNGNIGLTQNMDMLMDVAKELETNDDIHFVLVGNGAYKEKLAQIVQEKNITNVTLLPFQPYEEISYVFSLGDVSLVISKPGVGANSVPSKTWSIMSASRPVLANFDENELKTIIEENHCGIFTKAGDKTAFKEAILKLYNDHALCKELGKNGRQFILDNLTKEVGTQKYVNVLKAFEK